MSTKFQAYQIHKAQAGDPDLQDCLEAAFNHADRQVYIEVAGGSWLRLEHFEEQNGLLIGEFVRQQRDNLPPQAVQGRPLNRNDIPLGHRSVFIVDPQLNALLIEYERMSATPSKINAFVKSRNRRHRGFLFNPMLGEDALRRIAGQTPRKLKIRVANPSNLDMVDGENPANIEQNLAHFEEMLGANVVTITWGFTPGDRDSALQNGMLRRLVQWGRRNPDEVKAVAVETLEEENPVNMLGDQIASTVDLIWNNNDPEGSYVTRRDALLDFHREKRAIIRQLYG